MADRRRQGTQMRKVLKWIGRIATAMAILIVVAVIVIYVGSQHIVHGTYEASVAPVPIPTDAAAIAEGGRKARFLGCYRGCHGKAAEGRVLFGDSFLDRLLWGRLAAPDLTLVTHELSDVDLVRAIRYGIRPDGRSVWGMPSEVFYDLSDEDLGNIIAFLRSLPLSHGVKPGSPLYGIPRRAVLLTGTVVPTAERIDHDAPRLAPGGDADPIARGRYLSHVICSGCHGRDLSGGFAGINLTTIADYTAGQFRTLMRTKRPPDAKPSAPVDDQWAALGDREINAMYMYLGTTLAMEQAAGTREHVP